MGDSCFSVGGILLFCVLEIKEERNWKKKSYSSCKIPGVEAFHLKSLGILLTNRYEEDTFTIDNGVDIHHGGCTRVQFQTPRVGI